MANLRLWQVLVWPSSCRYVVFCPAAMGSYHETNGSCGSDITAVICVSRRSSESWPDTFQHHIARHQKPFRCIIRYACLATSYAPCLPTCFCPLAVAEPLRQSARLCWRGRGTDTSATGTTSTPPSPTPGTSNPNVFRGGML